MTHKPLLNAVNGIRQVRPPVWIMRQAGRYLPEYRQIREKAGTFLDLCYTPKWAIEVSLQPLKRFDLDAAILFSDILVVPDALGQKVWFEPGEGPRLEPLKPEDIGRLKAEQAVARLAPVLDALSGIQSELALDKTMIGFCGAPWTLATYMIGGKGSPDQAAARLFALNEPEAFRVLLDVLVEVSIEYLVAQFRAGADVVQLFESWALNLDERQFADYVIAPNRRIVEGVRSKIANAPIIGFPRGAAGLLGRYYAETGVSMLGIDTATPLEFVNSMVPATAGVQGNLDPLRVVAGGNQMRERALEIIEAFSGRPHVFNLGHGIIPQTPIDHVAELIDLVKGN